MKTTRTCFLVATLVAALASQVSTVSAQGPLTPAGPPAPTMKTLDQLDGKLDAAAAILGQIDSKAEKRIPISSLPFAISAPGSYYLTQNLQAAEAQNGITINANDVTLDLNGFALTGTETGGAAHGIIITSGNKNIAVRNGALRLWRGLGISAAGSLNTHFEGLRISDTGAGGLFAGANAIIRRCVVQNCNGDGIAGEARTLVQESIAHDQTGTGRGIVGGANSSVLSSIAHSNFGAGIEVSSNGTIVDCNASSNAGPGIKTTNSLIRDCLVSFNNNQIEAGSSSLVRHCRVSGQSGPGILVAGFSLVLENSISGNGPGGAVSGIRATGSANRIDGNRMASVGIGVEVTGTNNVIIRNVVMSSNNDYAVAAGNFKGTEIATEAALNSAANANVNVAVP